MLYTTVSDCINRKGDFIDKNTILEYVSEEDIFEIVFLYKPQIGELVTSPLREDGNPGCWFEVNKNGKLVFVDYAVKNKYRDCFDCIQEYFHLPNFIKTLEYIRDTLILGKNLVKKTYQGDKLRPIRTPTAKTQISFLKRDFTWKDASYWRKFGITSEQLILDKVFAVKQIILLTKKNELKYITTTDLAYAYTDFKFGRIKIYRPKNKLRFLTTCKEDDVGGLNTLSYETSKLIISKSYKDYRVLKNQGLNVIWFQSESMFPNEDILHKLLLDFKEITVFFDNDRTGVIKAEAFVKKIKKLFGRTITNVGLSPRLLKYKITDPADFYSYYGEQALNNFLKSKKLLE